MTLLDWDEQARVDADGAVWSEPGWGHGIAESLAWLGDLPAGRALDLGCGVGRLTIPWAARRPGVTVYGVDSSLEMLARADTRALLFDVGNVEWLAGDGVTLPDLRRLAAAWSMLVFQHLEAGVAEGYVHQVAGSLRSGGVFRLQFVDAALTGPGDVGPLSHPHHRDVVAGWFDAAGFNVGDVSVGGMRPTWTWMTGTRR